MKSFQIIEIALRIILTIIVFILPGYRSMLIVLKKLRNKIQTFFGIVSQMTPDDFLKEHHHEEIWWEQELQHLHPETDIIWKNSDEDTKISELWTGSDLKVWWMETENIAVDSKTSDKVQSLKQEAHGYKDKGQREAAEKKLIEAITILPHDYDIQKQLSEVYFEQGQFIKTATLLKKLLLQDPDNHKFLWQLGYIHMIQWDTNTAQLFFEKALEHKDDNPKYYISLIDIHTQSSAREHAIPLMEKLQKLRPSNIDYLLSLAWLHEEMNNIEKADYRYTKIIELDPHHPVAKQKLS